MTTKSFVAALVSIALILLAAVVIVVPASAVGQCGEAGCGRIFADDCSPSQRCVSKWGGYYCVDDPTCLSAPSETGTVTVTPTTTATSTPTTGTGSSCSSSGGVCRYWTGFYCYSGESDIGKKDCGSGQTCCYKAAAPKVTPTKTPTAPTRTSTPIPSTTTATTTTTCGDSWCGTFSRSCRPTEKCVASKLVWFFRVYHCVEDSACSGSAPADSGSTCGNGVCETGIGGETYSTCPQDCPKPVATSIPTSISKCPDGTPRFACSNSTPGKYCDGLGKLTTLARCSAAPTPTAIASCAAAGGECTFTASFACDSYGEKKDVGKKDCGLGQTCCVKLAETPEIRKAKLGCGNSCGFTLTCSKTHACIVSAMPGGSYCKYELECAKLADLQTQTATKILRVGRITNDIADVGDYEVTVTAVDTTGRNAAITVIGPTDTPIDQSRERKILTEGSSYRFFGSDVGGGVEVKLNAVTTSAAELAITYKE